MSKVINPAAPHHLPPFITVPGQTDAFLTGTAVFLVMVVVLLGGLYFRLHALPERIAHGTSKLQFQLVSVLALLALFTRAGEVEAAPSVNGAVVWRCGGACYQPYGGRYVVV